MSARTERALIDRLPGWAQLSVSTLALVLVLAVLLTGRDAIPLLLATTGVGVLGVGLLVTYIRRPVDDRDYRGLRISLLGYLLERLSPRALRALMIVAGAFFTLVGLLGLLAAIPV